MKPAVLKIHVPGVHQRALCAVSYTVSLCFSNVDKRHIHPEKRIRLRPVRLKCTLPICIELQ